MPQRSCSASKLNKDSRGTATLELAVILPFLMTLGFGTYEFGNLIYNYHMITVGVRDAARYLAGNPQVDDRETAAKNIAMRGTIDSSGEFRISWWTDPGTITMVSEGNPNGTAYRGGGSTITVNADVPYHELGFLEFLGLGPITLSVSHEEREYRSR